MSRWNRLTFVLFALGAIAYVRPLPAADNEAIEWLGECRLHRTSLADARKHLGAADLFTRAMSPFDRMSRLGRDADPGDEAIRQFAAEQAEAWSDADWLKITQAAGSLKKRLESLPKLPWPRDIQFIATTGREEGEAAYCRGPAVILPSKVVGRSAESLERLLAHELFHVLSNQNEKWRERLYAIVGFQPCGNIELPPDLAARKITNPDGALVAYALPLEVDGQVIDAAPILLSTAERFDPQQGGSFFRYLQFRLLVVERDAARGTWRPVLQDGRPRLLDPQKTPAYLERIGGNTTYIIHPDEILADNFVHLVFRTPNLRSPKLIEQLQATLTLPFDAPPRP